MTFASFFLSGLHMTRFRIRRDSQTFPAVVFKSRLISAACRLFGDTAAPLYAAPSRSGAWKKGAVSSSFRINSKPNEPGPQLLAMAEDAFCK